MRYLIGFMGYSVGKGDWFYHFSRVLVFTNSCVNPFIYAAKYRKFQDGVRRHILKIRPDQQQSQVT